MVDKNRNDGLVSYFDRLLEETRDVAQRILDRFQSLRIKFPADLTDDARYNHNQDAAG